MTSRAGVALVFESHATTVENERGIATGWLPGTLSDRGRQEARALGRRRRDDDLSAVFTSDLARAVETAEIAFGGTAVPIVEDARLRECDYGTLTGGPAARVGDAKTAHVDRPFPRGESYRQVVARVSSFLDEVGQVPDTGRVLVVGHSATRWAIDHLLTGRPLEELVAETFVWQDGWEYVLSSR